MIKTLIVDDEYLIRRTICSMIDWTGLGFEIIAEASDGLEALDCIEKYSPELIILDINIPLLDGIKVAGRVREEYPDIKIIVLTGYDTFDYIQQCMRAGVMNYVVKPIEKEEFEAAVINAKREILKKRNTDKFSEYFNGSDNTALEIESSDFLNDPSKNQSDFTDKFSLKLKQAGTAKYFVVLVEADYLRKKFKAQPERTFALMSAAMLIKDFLDKLGLSWTIHPFDQTILIGVFSPSPLNLMNCGDTFRRAADYVYENMDISLSCGVSDSFTETRDIGKGIAQAQKAIERKFCKGVGKIHVYDSTQIPYPDKKNFRIDTSIIINYLRQGEYGKATDQLHQTLWDAAANNFSKDYFSLIAADLVNCIIRFSIEVGLNTKEIFNQSAYMSHIDKFETAEELENWITGLYKNVISFARNQYLKRSDRLVSVICDYIEHNYQSENLSLTTISNHLFMTGNHLSKIFKQEMKITLTEYIVNFRMNKAKQLIDENREHQIISLSKAVGYSDPFYFSKTFKKFFGVSPSKYIGMQNS